MVDAAREDDNGVTNVNKALGKDNTGDDDANKNNYQGAISNNTTGEENSPPIASSETLL